MADLPDASPTARPVPPAVDPRGIPAELKPLRAWVGWRYVQRGGRWTKTPVDPSTGGAASSTDPATWGTFAEARRAKVGRGLDGVGIMLGEATGLVGVDLDHCLDAAGAPSALARDVVDALAAWTEITPSGAGLHVVLRGRKPDGARSRDSQLGLEVYDRARFFTVTGRVFEGRSAVGDDRSAALAAVIARHLPPRPAAPPAPPRPAQPVALADEELLRRARAARGGDAFAALWEGRWQGGRYGSQSEADLALCCRLAFWTGRDADRVDRLFRASALWREKWDHHRGQLTYGQLTVGRACAAVTEAYDPTRPVPRSGGICLAADRRAEAGAAFAKLGAAAKLGEEERDTLIEAQRIAPFAAGSKFRRAAACGLGLLHGRCPHEGCDRVNCRICVRCEAGLCPWCGPTRNAIRLELAAERWPDELGWGIVRLEGETHAAARAAWSALRKRLGPAARGRVRVFYVPGFLALACGQDDLPAVRAVVDTVHLVRRGTALVALAELLEHRQASYRLKLADGPTALASWDWTYRHVRITTAGRACTVRWTSDAEIHAMALERARARRAADGIGEDDRTLCHQQPVRWTLIYEPTGEPIWEYEGQPERSADLLRRVRHHRAAELMTANTS